MLFCYSVILELSVIISLGFVESLLFRFNLIYLFFSQDILSFIIFVADEDIVLENYIFYYYNLSVIYNNL